MTTMEMLEKLKSYQEILGARVALEEEIALLPKTIEAQNEMLSRLKKNFSDKEEAFTLSEEKIRELRQALQDAEMAREKAEQQMDGITTQREYEAINKEIRDATEKEQNLRKDIQQQERSFAEIEEELQKTRGGISMLEEEIAEKGQIIESQRETKASEVERLKTEELSIAEGIGSDILFKLERIIRNKKGVGVVPIHGVVCTGCHMILPANFVNEVRDEEATKVHFCPYCSRILFFEETEEAPEFIGDIESGSLADLADYAEEGEDEGDDDEEEQRDGEEQEKDFPPPRKPSARKAAAVREEYSEDSED
ncbi:MAG: C4-type zinc ribbon domain-containing protein [Spirochaetia bacterium]|jgi:predicted  nucleic acid-binding Zn-ribbon protein|nr:C4-type zinc ribbon domain-containing protein [Spirochaetales bacterium]MDX9783544.1 C4-type zinc ribbon domain-containing protein [Spirochaetia bacterium]